MLDVLSEYVISTGSINISAPACRGNGTFDEAISGNCMCKTALNPRS